MELSTKYSFQLLQDAIAVTQNFSFLFFVPENMSSISSHYVSYCCVILPVELPFVSLLSVGSKLKFGEIETSFTPYFLLSGHFNVIEAF